MGVEFSVGWESVQEAGSGESEGVPHAHMTAGNFRRVMEEGFGLHPDEIGVDWPMGSADPEALLVRSKAAQAWAWAQPARPVAGGDLMMVDVHRGEDILAVASIAVRLGRPVVWA